jgi:hypothetical protein
MGGRKIGHEHDRCADRLLRVIAADAGGPAQGPEDDHDQLPMFASACPARSLNMAVNCGEYEYDVALSFAGENREIVEQFARLLEAEGFSVFYDNWKKAELWGRDLYQHLDEVYSKKARFCLIFLSAAYAAKAWPNHELKSAQARAFQENEAYILPVRLDDTVIPGIRATVGYLDLRKDRIEEVAELAIRKITAAKARGTAEGRVKEATAAPAATKKPAAGSAVRSSNVRIKKEFTEHDRDTFLEEAYEYVATFFEESLAELQMHNEGIVGKFRRINANHFTATVYHNGKNVSECGIRLGGFFGSKQIVFSYDPDTTNSMNEAADVSDDGQTIFLKATGFSTVVSGKGKEKERLTPQDAAEMFWALLIAPLQR